MRHEHTFRHAGRAGRVDHIRRVLRSCRRNLACQRRRWLRRDQRRVTVQTQDRRRVERQFAGDPAVGEQHRERSVGRHETEAVLRIVRVERNVARAGLEDRQQRRQQIGSAIETQTDQ